MRAKIITLALLVAAITALHYGTAGGHPTVHLLHRELYFIPILLAGFWFGLRVALATSLCITLLYLPPILAGKMVHDTPYTVVAQLLMFNVVALMVGWVEDRRAREQERKLAAEKMALLGRAASAIGLEVQDAAASLRRISRTESCFGTTESQADILGEIDRLDHLLYALMRFVPTTQLSPISLDLGELAEKSVARLQETARKAGVGLTAATGPSGCRTRAVSEDFGGILDALVKNAIEASSSGGSVTIDVSHEGQMCRLTVRDNGRGIPPEHLTKIFLPFFSTKPGGHGLTLASTKKFLKDIGGDIVVESKLGQGAAFHLHIPRERAGDEPLEGFDAAARK
ncbi:MAG: ATP-binding protein [Desulfovibrio sp.]